MPAASAWDQTHGADFFGVGEADPADAAGFAFALGPRARGIGLGGHLDRLRLSAGVGQLRLVLDVLGLKDERGPVMSA